MSGIQVVSEVDVYEVNGKEVPIGATRCLKVSSHFHSSKAVLKFGRTSYTVDIDDLILALKNAGNTG